MANRKGAQPLPTVATSRAPDGCSIPESLLLGRSCGGFLWDLPPQQTTGPERPERDPLWESCGRRELLHTYRLRPVYGDLLQVGFSVFSIVLKGDLII